VLTFRALAAGALSEAAAYTAHLLEKTLPDDQMKMAEYYARTSGVDEALAAGMGALPTVRADLDPRLSLALGIKAGAVLSEKELGAILSGRRADATPLPGKKQPRRVETKAGQERFKVSGMDLCLSAPKSVSVAWAFAETDAERNSILQAHQDARDATLKYIEQEIGGRIGAGGKQIASEARMAWIAIDHFTARATIDITRPDPVTGVMGTELYTLAPNTPGDMQLHTHCIVPNITVTADGRFVALNTMKFHGRKKEFGAVYQAFLAANLRKAGIEVDLCERTLMAKLPIIPEFVCDEFSKRTGDAEASAREAAKIFGKDWDTMPIEAKVNMLKGGAHKTRRAKADDLANFAAWFQQAKDMGWHHKSAVLYGPPSPVENRLGKALATALPLVADLFWQRAVIYGSEARLQAVRGLIRWGMETTAEIGMLTKRMVTDGVQQNGRWTRLKYAESELGVKITTELHIEQEAELVELARAAAADTARALSSKQIAAAIARKGLKFEGPHGEKQRAGLERLGTGGELAVLIGVAGSGKSTLLSPLVEAWHAEGREVFGLALAWRQAGDLRGAGIKPIKVRALQNFLTGVHDGWTKVSANSVVVVDELGQIGTRQLLELLQLQKLHKFKIVAVGDDRQCQAIEAGAVIDLLRRALGPEAIPEILTTVRQRSGREREIATKFREGTTEAVTAALDMKRADETAELCEGGYREAVDRIAQIAMERRAECDSVSISALTNADALAISRAIRARRVAAGEISSHQTTITATDGTDVYQLSLAAGDRVRLFKRTRGVFICGGRKKDAQVGNNGSVVEIVAVREDGIDVKGQSGKTAFVAWSALRDESERIMLTLGDCLTIDSAQGLTSDEHIAAFPGGTRNVQAFKAYVSASRHRISSWMVVSKGEEMREIALRRPLGITDKITDENIWTNVARNLARQEIKETATAFMERAAATANASVHTFQAGMRKMEARAAKKKPRSHLKENVRRKDVVQNLSAIVGQISTQAGELQKERNMPTRIKVSEHDARVQFADFLRSAGFDLRGHDPIMNGQWHNVPLLGQKGRDKAGGYIGYMDNHPAGAIHNHRTDERRTWKADGEKVRISQQEADRLASAQKALSNERKRAEAAKHKAGGEKARAMFAKSKPADPNHPYLKRKGVGVHGIRQIGANLVVPLVDLVTGTIENLQFITPNGVKRPIKGARKQGLSHILGEPAAGKQIGLAEGYSTAASVHEVLGIPVAMAIDAGNLMAVATSIRARYLTSSILIAADNDVGLTRREAPLPNVGLEKAQSAAAAIGASISMPQSNGASLDWNDHSQTHGVAATAAAIRHNERPFSPTPSFSLTTQRLTF
jgi:phage/plasmid primase-like uncharacterized protein